MAGISDEDMQNSITDVKLWMDKSGKGILFQSLPVFFERMEKAAIKLPVREGDEGLKEVHSAMGKFEWDYFQRLTMHSLLLMEHEDPTSKSFGDRTPDKGRHFVLCAYLEGARPSDKELKRNRVFMIYHMHAAAAMKSVEDIRHAEQLLKRRIERALKRYPGNLCYGLLFIGGRAALYKMDGETFAYHRILNGESESFDISPKPRMFRPITDPELTKELLVLVNSEWMRIDQEHVRWTLHDRRFHPQLRNPCHLRELKGCRICSKATQLMISGGVPSNDSPAGQQPEARRSTDSDKENVKKPKHEDPVSGSEMSSSSMDSN